MLSAFEGSQAEDAASGPGGGAEQAGERSTARSDGDSVPTVASSASTKRGFKTCKWCRRTDAHPNPLIYQAGQCLAWRRAFGQECNVCPYVQEHFELLQGRTRERLLQDLKSEDFYKEYMAKVAEYERLKVESCGKRLFTGKPRAHQGISAEARETMQYKKQIGWLWPVQLFKSKFGKLPGRSRIQTHMINGQRVRGVLLDGSHGCPPGVIEVSKISDSSLVRKGDIADTDTHDPEELEASWARLQKRARVATTPTKEGEVGPVAIRFTGVAREVDPDGDEAMLDDIWGGAFGSSGSKATGGGASGDEEDTPKPPTKRAARPAEASGGQKSEGATAEGDKAPVTESPSPQAAEAPTKQAAKGKAGGRASAAPATGKAPSARLVQAELDRADQVLLACQQFKNSLSQDDLIAGSSVKGLKSLQQRVQQRLSSEHMPLYTSAYAGGDSVPLNRGLDTLSKLRAAASMLEAVSPFLACYHASAGEEATALVGAKTKLEQATNLGDFSITLAPGVIEVAARRFQDEAFSLGEYARFWSLTVSNGPKPTPPEISCTELPAARHTAVQRAAITRAVIDARRCSEAGTLQHLLEALPAQATFEDKALQTELFKVKAVVVRALGLDAAAVQQRSAQHCELLTNKQGAFHKALAVLPGGIAAMTEAQSYWDQCSADLTMAVELGKLKDLCEQLGGKWTCTTDEGRVTVSPLSQWEQLVEKHALIESTASTAFKEAPANAAVVSKAQGLLQDLCRAVCKVEQEVATNKLSEKLTLLREAAPPQDDPAHAAFQQLWDKTLTALAVDVDFWAAGSKRSLLHLFVGEQKHAVEASCKPHEAAGRAVLAAAPILPCMLRDEAVDVADQSVSVTVSRLKEAREAASTVFTGSFFTEFEQFFLGKVLDTGISQLGQQLESCVPFICHLLDPDTEPSAVFDEEYIGTCSDLTELDDGSDTLTKLCQTLQTHYLPLWTGPAKEVRLETTEAAVLGRPATTTRVHVNICSKLLEFAALPATVPISIGTRANARFSKR